MDATGRRHPAHRSRHHACRSAVRQRAGVARPAARCGLGGRGNTGAVVRPGVSSTRRASRAHGAHDLRSRRYSVDARAAARRTRLAACTHRIARVRRASIGGHVQLDGLRQLSRPARRRFSRGIYRKRPADLPAGHRTSRWRRHLAGLRCRHRTPPLRRSRFRPSHAHPNGRLACRSLPARTPCPNSQPLRPCNVFACSTCRACAPVPPACACWPTSAPT